MENHPEYSINKVIGYLESIVWAGEHNRSADLWGDFEELRF